MTQTAPAQNVISFGSGRLAATHHQGPVVQDCPDHSTWRELRAGTVGASESAGLVIAQPEDTEDEGEAVSPYLTPYQLYAIKTKMVGDDDEEQQRRSNRTEWGTALEPIIAETIARKRGWSYRKPAGYYLHPQVDRMAASLDYEVDIDGTGLFVPFEIKNVAGTEAWKWRNSVGDWVVPAWIQIQCQHQMAVTGCERAVVGVLFGGNEDRDFIVERDPDLIATIEESVEAFWSCVQAGEVPEPDFERDDWVIKRLNAQIDPAADRVLDWTGDNEAMQAAQAMKYHASQQNFHKKEADRNRMWLMHHLGGSECADLGQDMMVSSSEVAGQPISYYRKPYRKLEVKQPRKRHAGRTVEQAARGGGADS